MEEWKHFYESSQYNWFVSSHGRVRKVSKNSDYDRIIELSKSGGHKDHGRYYCFSMNDMPEKYLHRLVAKMFIPNPENKRTVNHIDGNKLNNRVDNLEWCTYTENMQHAFETGLRSFNKGYSKKGLKSQDVRLLENQIFNLKEIGLNYSEISEILNITRQHARITYIRFINKTKKQKLKL